MDRRRLLQIVVASIPSLPSIWSWLVGPRRSAAATRSLSRVRPADPEWPHEASWDRLSQQIRGKLLKVQSPLAECIEAPSSLSCTQIFKELKNPYYLGDEVGLTQSLGWVDAWTTDDVVAAVNFASENNLRLVVKGGGHSYQGTSNAADSLLIWTRRMNTITLQEAFVGSGCAGRYTPQQAVTVEPGAIWGQVYDAVTTKGGRYVQGGGCMTVGVAGLILSGGFGASRRPTGWLQGACWKPRSSLPMAKSGSPTPARIRTCSGGSRGAAEGASAS